MRALLADAKVAADEIERLRARVAPIALEEVALGIDAQNLLRARAAQL